MVPRLRVLLAEDHERVAAQLRRLLEAECIVIGAVRDGPSLVSAVDDLEPEVIVSDVAMPRVDGFGLIAAVRSAQAAGGMPVRAVALTAYSSDDLAERTRAAGFDAHASKPIEPDALVDLVVRLASDLPPRPDPAL